MKKSQTVSVVSKDNNSLFEKLRLPLTALAVIVVIYGGLVMRDLKNQVSDIKKQNQTISFNTVELQDKLASLQTETDSIKSNNDNLTTNLASAQNQIAVLQKTSGIKKVASASAFKTAESTTTVTQTVTQEVEKNQATITIQNLGSYKVDLQAGDNSFDVLKRAASQNDFALDYDVYSFGVYIKSIGGIAPQGNQYWAFYFNGAFSNVGASDQPVVKGDSIFWQLSTFE